MRAVHGGPAATAWQIPTAIPSRGVSSSPSKVRKPFDGPSAYSWEHAFIRSCARGSVRASVPASRLRSFHNKSIPAGRRHRKPFSTSGPIGPRAVDRRFEQKWALNVRRPVRRNDGLPHPANVDGNIASALRDGETTILVTLRRNISSVQFRPRGSRRATYATAFPPSSLVNRSIVSRCCGNVSASAARSASSKSANSKAGAVVQPARP
jgi:hypothetical protein